MKTLSGILVVTVFVASTMAVRADAEDTKAKADGTAAVSALAAVPAPAEKTTLDNLQAAFNGESNANARYLAFAKRADAEGYGKVASLFRAAARAEQVHFERHAKVIRQMGGTPGAKIETPVVQSTAQNLKAAFDGETYETTVMYPEFLKKAEADKNKDAIDIFEDAKAAEAVHAALYKRAMNDMKGWIGANENFYVCPVCGNVVEKTNFKKCPICSTGSAQFMPVT